MHTKVVIFICCIQKLSFAIVAYNSYCSFDAILRFLLFGAIVDHFLGCGRVKKLAILEKSQNCVKAAIAFVCKNCKWQLLYALLLLTTFVCTFTIDNICKHHGYSYAWLNCSFSVCAIGTANAMQLTGFVCTIALNDFCKCHG